MMVTSSYVEDRTLMMETDDGTKEIEITAGVAQGSVGGPTISNIHYEALLRLILPKHVVLVGFSKRLCLCFRFCVSASMSLSLCLFLRLCLYGFVSTSLSLRLCLSLCFYIAIRMSVHPSLSLGL